MQEVLTEGPYERRWQNVRIRLPWLALAFAHVLSAVPRPRCRPRYDVCPLLELMRGDARTVVLRRGVLRRGVWTAEGGDAHLGLAVGGDLSRCLWLVCSASAQKGKGRVHAQVVCVPS